MSILRFVIAAVLAALLTTAVSAQKKRSFESLWGEATAGEHELIDYAGYTMVDGGDVFWYFTKPGHEAYPAVVRRALMRKDERFFIDTQGWSFAAEAGQPGFKNWLKEFDVLNRRLLEAVERQRHGG